MGHRTQQIGIAMTQDDYYNSDVVLLSI